MQYPIIGENRCCPPDPEDELDDEWDHDPPDLMLCVHWKIDGDWGLMDRAAEMDEASFLVCQDDISGDWFEVDTALEEWERITYH